MEIFYCKKLTSLVRFLLKFSNKIQWASENRTSPVFEWLKAVWLSNGSVFKWQLNTEHFMLNTSSLHWNFSLSCCSFSYSGVYFEQLKLSVSDVIVNQKDSNGDEKLHFYCGPIFLLALSVQRYIFRQKYTPLYKKEPK